MVKTEKKKRNILNTLVSITAVIYSVWVLLYLIGFFLYSGFFNKIDSGFYLLTGFIVTGLISVSIIIALIEKLHHDPFILFSVFILGGRLIGFIAANLFLSFTKYSYFLLPFGGIDFFIFYFLIIGFFSFLRKSVLSEQKHGFNALSLLALLFFAVPIFFHIIGKELTYISVYSLVFTLIPVIAILSAPYHTNLKSVKLIIVSVIMAAFFDMLIYLQFTAWNIPHGLNYLLFPYSFFIFTAGVIRREREVADG